MSPLPILAACAAMTSPASQSTELTIYNQGFALVKDTRQLQLKAGVQSVAVEDVAQQIEPDSVGFRSISAAGSFTVLEQNYQYDLISPQAILMKAVGGPITFRRVLPNGQVELLKGTLLSAPGTMVGVGNNYTYSGMVIKTNDGKIILSPTGEIEVSSLPEGLISKPTLMWMLDSEKAGPNTVELSYLTQGISWQSAYVLNLDQAGKMGDLKGWVTLNNGCGATFTDAKLKLLAGEVSRAERNTMPRGAGGRAMMESAAKAADFGEEQFADYHLYTLNRPATVRNNEQKQVSLLEASGITVTKRLVIDAMRNYQGWRAQEGEVGTGTMQPQIRIELKNSKENKMGMALPAGTVKVFQRDRSGSLQMLGEDSINHTPKEETLSLVVGRAFDIVCERKRTAFEYIYSNSSRSTPIGAREVYKIELRNRKETEETVDVIERYWGEWTITSKTDPFEKLTADSFRFVVKLKPNEVRSVVYTIENRWAR